MIFRPALIAHPSHELSPQEHQLSQEVLEFLIAHQDWFMLDIPPPPSLSDSPHTIPTTPVDSGSDDEQGWKLVNSPRRIVRRRTTTERSSGVLHACASYLFAAALTVFVGCCREAQRGQ